MASIFKKKKQNLIGIYVTPLACCPSDCGGGRSDTQNLMNSASAYVG